jgi:hypothetical protein
MLLTALCIFVLIARHELAEIIAAIIHRFRK